MENLVKYDLGLSPEPALRSYEGEERSCSKPVRADKGRRQPQGTQSQAAGPGQTPRRKAKLMDGSCSHSYMPVHTLHFSEEELKMHSTISEIFLSYELLDTYGHHPGTHCCSGRNKRSSILCVCQPRGTPAPRSGMPFSKDERALSLESTSGPGVRTCETQAYHRAWQVSQRQPSHRGAISRPQLHTERSATQGGSVELLLGEDRGPGAPRLQTTTPSSPSPSLLPGRMAQYNQVCSGHEKF